MCDTVHFLSICQTGSRLRPAWPSFRTAEAWHCWEAPQQDLAWPQLIGGHCWAHLWKLLCPLRSEIQSSVTKHYHERVVLGMLWQKNIRECGSIPCLCCELPLWLRKCMANCWRGPARPSSPGTDGGIMRGPEMPSFGAFNREPRVSSTLSTSSPQCLVNSFISICAQRDRV